MTCAKIVLLVTVTIACVNTKPFDNLENIVELQRGAELIRSDAPHNVQKRFINPSLTSGSFDDGGLPKLRTKRSEEDCEKLALCKLHARSGHSFFAAYELYFVNKENARLWDHHARTIADCQRRFPCYDR